MNRFVLTIAAATAAVMTMASPIAAQETLMVGSECTYFPFNYRDSDGVLKGYDIDVANEIGKRLKAKTEYVCMKFDGLLPALLAGKFDLIAASLSITEDRRQKIDFSEPYRLSIGQFVAPKAKKLAREFASASSARRPMTTGSRRSCPMRTSCATRGSRRSTWTSSRAASTPS
jgi:polar amino acid transport system substrate-binding protein